MRTCPWLVTRRGSDTAEPCGRLASDRWHTSPDDEGLETLATRASAWKFLAVVVTERVPLCDDHVRHLADRFAEMDRNIRQPILGEMALARRMSEEERERARLVYVLRRARDGAIKIGVSAAPGTRVQDLAREHGPLAILFTTPGGQSLETRLHRQFAPYRLPGNSREWFHEEGDLAEWIARITERRERVSA